MKKILAIILFFVSLCALAQENKTTFDGHNWNAPYYLEIPKGWSIERFIIPIEFAPAIPYKGVEDIRFTPGWGKKETEDYWSYAFLWYLDSTQNFSSKIIAQNLAAYYTGLIEINTDKTKVYPEKIIPVKVSIKNKNTEKGDSKTFEGKVTMADFLTRKPIMLNILIHIKYCAGQNKTFVFHELSPKPYDDKVWKDLNQLWLNFRCSN